MNLFVKDGKIVLKNFTREHNCKISEFIIIDIRNNESSECDSSPLLFFLPVKMSEQDKQLKAGLYSGIIKFSKLKQGSKCELIKCEDSCKVVEEIERDIWSIITLKSIVGKQGDFREYLISFIRFISKLSYWSWMHSFGTIATNIKSLGKDIAKLNIHAHFSQFIREYTNISFNLLDNFNGIAQSMFEECTFTDLNKVLLLLKGSSESTKFMITMKGKLLWSDFTEDITTTLYHVITKIGIFKAKSAYLRINHEIVQQLAQFKPLIVHVKDSKKQYSSVCIKNQYLSIYAFTWESGMYQMLDYLRIKENQILLQKDYHVISNKLLSMKDETQTLLQNSSIKPFYIHLHNLNLGSFFIYVTNEQILLTQQILSVIKLLHCLPVDFSRYNTTDIIISKIKQFSIYICRIFTDVVVIISKANLFDNNEILDNIYKECEKVRDCIKKSVHADN